MRENLDFGSGRRRRRAGEDVRQDRDIAHAAGDIVPHRLDDAVDHVGKAAIDQSDRLAGAGDGRGDPRAQQGLEDGRGAQAALGDELRPGVAGLGDDLRGLDRGCLHHDAWAGRREHEVGSVGGEQVDNVGGEAGLPAEQRRPGVGGRAQPAQPLAIAPGDDDLDRFLGGCRDIEGDARREAAGAGNQDVAADHLSAPAPLRPGPSNRRAGARAGAS